MNLRNPLAVLLFLVSLSFVGQPAETENVVGLSVSIPSKVLNESREIQVFLPDNYSEGDTTYPVLYVLDGQRFFLHAVSVEQSMSGFEQTPEFIVVGISKNATERNRNFSSNAINFLDFIETELIPYIDSRFRTSKDRMLFGWGFAGGFAIQTLIDRPNLFNTYIAASPFPVSSKIEAMDKALSSNTTLDGLLYFSSDINEGKSVTEGTTQLNQILIDKAPESMSWEFRELEGEEHRSSPFTTLYHGLRKQFHYYPELQFSSLEDFQSAGGLEYVYDHYKRRASAYGFPETLSDWTMFSLTRNAIRANDFNQFEHFMQEFKPSGFIDRIRVSRSCLMAEFYLKHQEFEKAKELFTIIERSHPDAARVLQGLSDAYKGLKQDERAKTYDEKAKALSGNN